MIKVEEQYLNQEDYRVTYGGTTIFCDEMAFDNRGIYFYLGDEVIAALIKTYVKEVSYEKIYSRLQRQWAEILNKEVKNDNDNE